MKEKSSLNSLDNQIIKMSNILARKTPKHAKNRETLTQTEQRLFYMALAKANTIDEKGVVRLKKSEVFEKMGVNDSNMWTRYKEIFKAMQMKTYYDFDYSEDEFEAGFLIYKVQATKNYFHIRFDIDYVPLLKAADQYTTMFFDDIMRFECKHSAPLYQRIRSLNEHPKFGEYYDFSTSELKEVFGLTIDDYVNKTTGKFKRPEFEKQTLYKAVEEINEKAQLVKNVKVEKHKRGNKVLFYRIKFENQKLVSTKDLDENVVPGQTRIDDFIDVEEEKNSTFGYYYYDVKRALKPYADFSNEEIDAIFVMARRIVMKTMDLTYTAPNMIQVEIEMEANLFLNRLAMQLRVKKDIKNKFAYLIGVLEKKDKGDDQDD